MKGVGFGAAVDTFVFLADVLRRRFCSLGALARARLLGFCGFGVCVLVRRLGFCVRSVRLSCKYLRRNYFGAGGLTLPEQGAAPDRKKRHSIRLATASLVTPLFAAGELSVVPQRAACMNRWVWHCR